jgi:hypothetical protein
MSTPTPDINQFSVSPTPTPTNKACIKPPKISFIKGNSTIVAGKDCCCPDSLKVKCEYLSIGKRYTVKLDNLGPASGRQFPRSISFLAKNRTEEFDFFSQFLCDDNQNNPLTNTRYILSVNAVDTIDLSTLDIKVLNPTIGNVSLSNTQYSLKTYDRFIQIDFDNVLVPTTNKPIKYGLSINGSNIISTGKQVSIGSVGLVSDEINLVIIDQNYDSIGITKENLQQNTNGLIDNVIISVPSTAKKSETALVSIPQGTKFYDENGDMLSGTLSAVVAQFSPLETESLNSFPGGFFINNSIDTNGSENNENFYFYSAGFISIEVTDSEGRSATSLSQDMNIVAQVNPNVINPNNTFATVASGDTVPLWSIGPDMIWREEQQLDIQFNSNGLPYTTFNTNHLTTFNLDWKIDACSSISLKLSDYITIPPENVNSLFIDLYTDPSGGPGADRINNSFRTSPGSVTDGILKLLNYPNLPIRISVYADRNKNKLLGSINISRCGAVPSEPLTPTPTPSVTPTNTPTRSLTPTPTPTTTVTPSFTPTQTPLPIGSSDN